MEESGVMLMLDVRGNGASNPPGLYGDLISGRIQVKTTVDGVDITSDCRFADEDAGVAVVLVRDEQGRPIFQRDGALEKEMRGDVRIEVTARCQPVA